MQRGQFQFSGQKRVPDSHDIRLQLWQIRYLHILVSFTSRPTLSLLFFSFIWRTTTSGDLMRSHAFSCLERSYWKFVKRFILLFERVNINTTKSFRIKIKYALIMRKRYLKMNSKSDTSVQFIKCLRLPCKQRH